MPSIQNPPEVFGEGPLAGRRSTSDGGPRGFTVVEVVVAAIVLVVFAGGAWLIYRGVAGAVRQSSWSMTAQQTARQGLAFLREEMARATYRSEVTVNSVETQENDYQMELVRGRTTAGPGVTVLARWAICAPFTDKGGYVFRSSLVLNGSRLLYSRTQVEPRTGSVPNEPAIADKLLMEDVAAITLTPSTTPGVASATLLQIEVELADPRHPAVRVTERTAANVEVRWKDL
ncbi:MAG: hypothetical protein OZSIB_2301 [Candidatus Ozemobacter sibiricus]|jgi:type II secretory pathway component PulJ|uniref:Prepilin-type N-terminal cleavage/methylation domain-containing protein n=1 Tax=Candidatus Ozemobacter sibiricus TaxID=2268124 RepID=A0A367ZVQ0_9BACT|nr:MAG: hypothetical protein OZSIB_2301 [Candidatus Ozemobacter sibiricus]